MADRVAAPVAIIGAGYAGMATAVELATAGVPAEVFEASRTLGGRARGIDIEGLRLDNGAHILVGAYTETLRLMHLAGVPEEALKRQPLHLEYSGQFRLKAPRLPAPLHLAWALLTAQGLAWTEKLAAVRFMRTLKAIGFLLPSDMSVGTLLAEQPEKLRRYLWEPLCLAALNTLPAEASAQVFLNVLHDSLAADRSASDLLLPATDFSELFPEPAARFVEARGSSVHRGRRIESIQRTDAGYILDGNGPYARVVLAVAPYHLPGLIADLPELAELAAQVSRLRWEPIVTCYLGYPESVTLPLSMVGMEGGIAQWLFDRGALCGQHGVITAVISAHGRHEQLDNEALAAAIHEEVGRMLPGLPAPYWHRVVVEKRATFACTPGVPRPLTFTRLPGLLLAGDYVAGDYPATIEGAVRSGVAAARSVLQQPSGSEA